MPPLRLGIVPYANVLPLLEGLETRFPRHEWTRATPRELAALMARGAVDVATLPVFDALRTPGCRLVPGCAIGSDGPVRSVALFSNVPLGSVRRVLLDRSSLTSAHLVQVLAAELLGIAPEYTTSQAPVAADFDLAGSGYDAALVIGDNALRWQRRGFPHVLDLGEGWKRLTGLPFVFAAWVVRPGVEPTAEDLRAFIAARERGEADVAAIARREAATPQEQADLEDYLTNAIRFPLGTEQLAAIDLYRRKLADHGLLPPDARTPGVLALP